MKNFEVINREYINPVDLTVLGQTFNTLEKGHQATIAAATELETAMANLDLNEAESEWRQQKINEIKNGTPKSEVINPAGNSAGAIIVLAIVSLISNKIAP